MNKTILRASARRHPLLACGLLLAAASPVQATNFSLLLGSDDDSGKQTITNPTYEESANQGTNALYEPSAIVIWPDQFLEGRQLLLEGSFQESIAGDIPPAPGNGYAFELKLTDTETGQQVTQFTNPIDIGLVIPGVSDLHPEGTVHRDLALGFLDESLTPPEWRVEDKVLETCDKGTLCGNTDHFTIFSIGAVPEPTALALLLMSASFVWRRSVRL